MNDNNTQGERGKHFALLSKQYPNIEMNNHILLKAYVRQSSGVVLRVKNRETVESSQSQDIGNIDVGDGC